MSSQASGEQRVHGVWNFLNSNAGVAILTIILGSVLAHSLTCAVQSRTIRNEQRLIRDRELVEKQIQAVSDLNQEIGSILAACEALIGLSGPDFTRRTTSGGEVLQPTIQTAEIKRQFNQALDSWQRKRPHFRFLMTYYWDEAPEALEGLEAVESAVADYTTCVYPWHEPQPERYTQGETCRDEYQGLVEAVEELNRRLSGSLGWNR